MLGEFSKGSLVPRGVAALSRPSLRLEPPWIFKLDVTGQVLVLALCLWLTLRLTLPRKFTKYLDTAVMASLLVTCFLLGAFPAGLAQTPPSTSSQTGTTTSYREVFTVPADSDVGQPLLPNIEDPEAVDAQAVCPGYTASNVQNTTNGFTADLSLSGAACNVYGNEIEQLTLTVEYQALDRLHVGIQPRYIGPQNETWFILPEAIVPKPASPTGSDGAHASPDSSDLELSWTNDPTFSFTVKRKAGGDTLFTTDGSKIVYEDQFIEFVSRLPENYNLYGLGEVMHGFRLGNNLTSRSMAVAGGHSHKAQG
jgi:alpha-glucosidase